MQPAISLAKNGIMNVQLAPDEHISSYFISTGFPVIYPISVAFKVFGSGMLQARSVMVVYLLAFIIFFYILGKSMFSSRQAFYATFLLISFAPLYGNGKAVLGEVPGLFWLVFALYCLHRIEDEKGGLLYYLLGGLAVGLCIVTKPLYLLLLPALGLAIMLERKYLILRRNFAIGAFIVFLIPLLIWMYTQFQGSVSVTAVLGYYVNPYNVYTISILYQNFLRFFTEASPAYFFTLFIVWTVAIGIRFLEKRHTTAVEIAAYFFTLLIVLAYLRTAGWYRYFFPAEVVTLLFIPISLEDITAFLRKNIALFDKLSIIKSTPMVILVCLVLIHFYQLFFSSWVAQYYDSTITSELSAYVSNFNPKQSIFIYDSPELVPFLPTTNFYQYLELDPTFTIGAKQLVTLAAGIPDSVVVKRDVWEKNMQQLQHYAVNSTFNRYILLKRK